MSGVRFEQKTGVEESRVYEVRAAEWLDWLVLHICVLSVLSKCWFDTSSKGAFVSKIAVIDYPNPAAFPGVRQKVEKQ
ncbi:hypothetical protein LZ554_000619 [Drepanopeziza brunnea f. sp. 'monogermtubi']|nr:hypothetical protein LZ554_000619 [Drepanopeziza brunnea f. sp. 'monogermtubi']